MFLIIGSVRCKSNPLDGDCAVGFLCIELTSSSMADELFASVNCSELNIESARRGVEMAGRKRDLL